MVASASQATLGTMTLLSVYQKTSAGNHPGVVTTKSSQNMVATAQLAITPTKDVMLSINQTVTANLGMSEIIAVDVFSSKTARTITQNVEKAKSTKELEQTVQLATIQSLIARSNLTQGATVNQDTLGMLEENVFPRTNAISHVSYLHLFFSFYTQVLFQR